MTEPHQVTSTGNGAYQQVSPPSAPFARSLPEFMLVQFSSLVKRQLKFNELALGPDFFKRANPIRQTTEGLKAVIEPEIQVEVTFELNLSSLIAFKCGFIPVESNEDANAKMLQTVTVCLYSLVNVLLVRNSYYEPNVTAILHGNYVSADLVKTDYEGESLVSLARLVQFQSMSTTKRVTQTFFALLRRVQDEYGLDLESILQHYKKVYDLETIPATPG